MDQYKNDKLESLLKEVSQFSQHIQDLVSEIATIKSTINALKAEQYLFMKEVSQFSQHIQDLVSEIATIKSTINALKAEQYLFMKLLNPSIQRFDWGEEDTIDSGINRKKHFKPGPY